MLDEWINSHSSESSPSYLSLGGVPGSGKTALVRSLKTLALSQFSSCITRCSLSSCGSSVLEKISEYLKLRYPLSSLIPLMSPLYFAPTANALAPDHTSGLYGVSPWAEALGNTQNDIFSVCISSGFPGERLISDVRKTDLDPLPHRSSYSRAIHEPYGDPSCNLC